MLEINRLCSVIDFNGITLLDGTSAAATTGAGVNLQVGNNAGGANIINLDSSLFQSAKVTALIITGNAQCKGGESAWYQRSNAKEATSALQARITGQPVELSNGTKYDYSDTTKYKDLTTATYDPLDDGSSIQTTSCITAICDAVYTDDATAREFLSFVDDAISNVSARTALIGVLIS